MRWMDIELRDWKRYFDKSAGSMVSRCASPFPAGSFNLTDCCVSVGASIEMSCLPPTVSQYFSLCRPTTQNTSLSLKSVQLQARDAHDDPLPPRCPPFPPLSLKLVFIGWHAPLRLIPATPDNPRAIFHALGSGLRGQSI